MAYASVYVPQKLNDLSKQAIKLSDKWKRMVCTNDDRSTFVMAQLEQVRNEIDAEMNRLRSIGYKVAYDTTDCLFYAIKGDVLCQIL